jgi:hypothetical protein
MQQTISEETRARIERMAKLLGRTPEQVVDDIVKRSEQELIAHVFRRKVRLPLRHAAAVREESRQLLRTVPKSGVFTGAATP